MLIKKNKSGFTLIELLVCLGILVVLAAISVPIIVGITNTSNEKSDKLTAELYTSYMTQYSDATPQPIANYTWLSTNELEFVKSAGQGYYPGALLVGTNYYANDKELWSAIREEAVVAIKMYGKDIPVTGDYLVSSPRSADKSFIYYYLKGTVTVENVEDVANRTAENVANDVEALENYWIALDTEQGNTNGVYQSTTQGNVFIKLYRYGIGDKLPINDLGTGKSFFLISTTTGRVYRPTNKDAPNFANNNILQFSKIPNGKYQLQIQGSEVTKYPNNSIYSKLGSFSSQGLITVSNSGNFAGKTLSNPYNVYLLKVTSAQITTKTNQYDYSAKKYKPLYYSKDSTFKFESDLYSTTYSGTGPYFPLYDTTNSNYLPVNNQYKMTFTSDGCKTQVIDVNATKSEIKEVSTNEGGTNYTVDVRKNKVNISCSITGLTNSYNASSKSMICSSLSKSQTDFLSSKFGCNLASSSYSTMIFLIPREGGSSMSHATSSFIQTGADTWNFTFNNVPWTGEKTLYDIYFQTTLNNGSMFMLNSEDNPIIVEGYDIINANFSIAPQIYAPNIDVEFNLSKFSGPPAVLTIYNSSNVEMYNSTNRVNNLTLPAGIYKLTIKHWQGSRYITDTVYVLVSPSNRYFELSNH